MAVRAGRKLMVGPARDRSQLSRHLSRTNRYGSGFPDLYLNNSIPAVLPRTASNERRFEKALGLVNPFSTVTAYADWRDLDGRSYRGPLDLLDAPVFVLRARHVRLSRRTSTFCPRGRFPECGPDPGSALAVWDASCPRA